MRIVILVTSLWLVTSSLWGKIVFYSKRDGNVDIYTMESDGSDQKRLTFNEARDRIPAWSPNGRQIVFQSYRDEKPFHHDDPRHLDGNGEIYVMDADGGNQRRLTRDPGLDSSPSWHPDGTRIVFNSTRNSDKANPNLNIFVMDDDGSNIKQITDLEFASNPEWSPDGKQIAFEGFIGGDREIFVVNTDGTGRFKVSNPRPDAAMFLGGWSPDGKQILYTEAVDSRADKSFPVIATLNLIGQKNVKRWDRVPVPRMPFNTASFSADGKSILFSGKRDNQWNLYRFRLADRKLIQLTFPPSADAAPHEWNPRLSVQPQSLLPLFWGKIKSKRLRH